jgi:hypothetical protein
MEDSNPQIFISYSRDYDREAATAIYRQLCESGYSPWIDVENILPGQIWDHEVELAISRSKIFLVLISEEMIESRGYVHDEWHMALDIQKEYSDGRLFVIPIRLDDCKVPFLLRRFQWIDWFEDVGKERLFKRIAQILDIRSIENINPSNVDQSKQKNLCSSTFNPWYVRFGWKHRPILAYALA